MPTYLVKRHMIGDKDYKPGDKRELREAEAAALLRSGALVPFEEKKETEPKTTKTDSGIDAPEADEANDTEQQDLPSASDGAADDTADDADMSEADAGVDTIAATDGAADDSTDAADMGEDDAGLDTAAETGVTITKGRKTAKGRK